MSGSPSGPPKNLEHLTTSWTRLELAGTQTPEGRAALSDILSDYWRPLYHYVRRKGVPADDAKDKTQGFVEHMLTSDLLSKAERDRGSFRSLLRQAFDNWLRNEHRQAARQKRGGDFVHVEMDFTTEAGRYAADPNPNASPDEVLHQRWADALRERVDAEVRQYYAHKDQLERYEALVRFVSEPASYGDYARLGEQLGMSRNHVAVFVERLTKRWRQSARLEAGWLFGDGEAAGEELRALGIEA